MLKRIACAIAAGSLVLAACESDSPGENPFYTLDEPIEGHTCEALLADWANWAIHRPPIEEGPDFCAEGPTGDVWFLAVEPGPTSQERSCTLPDDVSIFFLKSFSSAFACPEPFPEPINESECAYSTDASMLSFVTENLSAPQTYEVELDGASPEGALEEYTCVTPFDMTYDPAHESRYFVHEDEFEPGVPFIDFDCTAPWEAGNICGVPAGPRRAVFGGRYYAIHPLKPGQYTLRYGGCIGTTDPVCADYTFHLTVVPRAEL